jgi:hypothetical protein
MVEENHNGTFTNIDMTLTDFKFFTSEPTTLFDELGRLLHRSVVGNYYCESTNFLIIVMNFVGDDTYECVVSHKRTYVSRSVTFKLNLGGTDELTIN